MATFIPNVTDVFPEPALFTPDFSFMDKMLQRRQSMYDQGWSQVNAAYNFVNKELTNPQNIKDRDVFLMQAKNNLKNLAGVDLSQHQNVMSAKGVFEPWVNNVKALGDASLTSHWKQQEAIGEGYRLEDGGKYFNQYNIDYVKKQRAAFANDAAESWEDYWKGKRSYTPYHDYHKHVEELMKNFKPSSYKIDRVNGLYKFTDENASWTQAEIRKYLEANLSDQDKQQMKIEADVIYNGDPKQMGQVYTTMAKDEIQQYDNGIAFYNKQLKSETKPEEIQKIKDYIGTLQDRKKTLTTNLDAINKGDYTYVKKKGEDIAMNIFFNQYMNKVSNGWTHKDITHKIDADQVALTVYKENREDVRQQRGFEHAEKMARLKGEIAPPPQLNTISTGETVENSLGSIQLKLDNLDAQNTDLDKLNRGMVATWMQSLPENKGKTITIADVNATQLTKYRNEGDNGRPLPANHMFLKNEEQMQMNESLKSIESKKIDYVRGEIEKRLSPEQIQGLAAARQQVARLGSVKTQEGDVLSATTILDAIQRNPDAVKLNSDSEGMSGWTLKIGNKKYSTYSDPSGSYNTDLATLIEKVQNAKNSLDAFKNYDSQVKDYFDKHGKEINNISNLFTFAQGSYEAKTMEAEMHNIFPESNYSIQSAGIGADVHNQGSGYFYITPKEGTEASSENITSYLKQRGYKDVEAISMPNGPTLYQIKNYKSPVTAQYAQFNPMERAVIQDLSSNIYTGNGGSFTSAPYKSYSQRLLQIKKEHNLYWLMVQGLEGGNTMDMFSTPFSDPASAVMKGQQLTANVGGVSEAYLQEYQRLQNQ